MKLYWEQHKVFFVATLALFPDKLNGHEVNELFYAPYFIGKNTDFIGLELEEYRKAGYLKYEKPAALYKIIDVNTKKAAKDLTQYLKEWQQSKLVSLSASKPPDPAYQKELLLDAIVRARANHQNEPRITLENVYGERGDYTYEPPFWELTLSYHLLESKVDIIDIGYDQRKDGLYEDYIQPFVDFKIVDKRLLSIIHKRLAQKSKTMAPSTLDDNVTALKQRAQLTMPDKYIFVELDNNKRIKINEHELRTDLAPYSLIKRILKHPTIPVTLQEARKLDGCEDVRNLSEVIRQCGFSVDKKKLFFEITTAKKVQLKKDVYLSPEEIALLAK